MLSVGMDKGSAASTISEASAEVDWVPVRAPDAGPRPLIRYFSAQDAVGLCESAFCRNCPRYPGGCPELQAAQAERG